MASLRKLGVSEASISAALDLAYKPRKPDEFTVYSDEVIKYLPGEYLSRYIDSLIGNMKRRPGMYFPKTEETDAINIDMIKHYEEIDAFVKARIANGDVDAAKAQSAIKFIIKTLKENVSIRCKVLCYVTFLDRVSSRSSNPLPLDMNKHSN